MTLCINQDNKIDQIIDANIKSAIHKKLSVIIVTFNRANLLNELLKSLQKQSFKDFEIIVVDNNSKDNTKEIIISYNFLYIKLIKNFGASIGRNIGLKYAEGEIVCFLDDDAIVDETFVESHHDAHIENDILCLRGKVLPKSKAIYNCKSQHYDLGDEIIPSVIDIEGNSSFKKFILDDVGGFDPDLFIHKHEGIDITYRILKKYGDDINKSIYYPKAVIYHDYAKGFFNFLNKIYINQKQWRELSIDSPERLLFLSKFPARHSNPKYEKKCRFFFIFCKFYVKLIRRYLNIRYYTIPKINKT